MDQINIKKSYWIPQVFYWLEGNKNYAVTNIVSSYFCTKFKALGKIDWPCPWRGIAPKGGELDPLWARGSRMIAL